MYITLKVPPTPKTPKKISIIDMSGSVINTKKDPAIKERSTKILKAFADPNLLMRLPEVKTDKSPPEPRAIPLINLFPGNFVSEKRKM